MKENTVATKALLENKKLGARLKVPHDSFALQALGELLEAARSFVFARNAETDEV